MEASVKLLDNTDWKDFSNPIRIPSEEEKNENFD